MCEQNERPKTSDVPPTILDSLSYGPTLFGLRFTLKTTKTNNNVIFFLFSLPFNRKPATDTMVDRYFRCVFLSFCVCSFRTVGEPGKQKPRLLQSTLNARQRRRWSINNRRPLSRNVQSANVRALQPPPVLRTNTGPRLRPKYGVAVTGGLCEKDQRAFRQRGIDLKLFPVTCAIVSSRTYLVVGRGRIKNVIYPTAVVTRRQSR